MLVFKVTKLDMSIREHRGELEQKIIKLEAKLEKAELQIKDCNKQVLLTKINLLKIYT